jgi:hypothetical protein
MRVKTHLRAGRAVDTNPPAQPTNKGVGDTLAGISQQARAALGSPRVRGVARQLVWWPFGPPRFL